MTALFSAAPRKQDASALAALGLTPEDFPEHEAEFDVWPDNAVAVNVFIAMQTQWRTGLAGATGLDYAALPAVLRLVGVPEPDQPDTFECLRSMEAEALTIMERKRG
ncbi:MAG: DUF1799 domain-containing protein [Pseudoxanthomonas sp.]|nr:DUF1799 domain-containing protein [Pseudoxanthomonas sp.]